MAALTQRKARKLQQLFEKGDSRSGLWVVNNVFKELDHQQNIQIQI